jgi:hypothetical protein
MIPFRLQIKYFVENPDAVELAPFIGLFQRWIQEKKLDELLVDVADYGHVFQGPGVVLIGHESDYALDMGGGRPGLLYTRKRQQDTGLEDQLRQAFHRALTACKVLEAERSLKLKFRTDEAEVRFVDRLELPNTPESLAAVKDALGGVLAEVYGAPVSIAPLSSDPRHVLALGVRAEQARGLDALLGHLQPGVAR